MSSFRCPYRGWQITFSELRPVTSRFVAQSKGVELNAGSEDAIHRMVDTRIREYPPDGHGGCIFRKFDSGE